MLDNDTGRVDAHASVITQNLNLNSGPSGSSNSAGATYNLFNPTLGTLTSATATFTNALDVKSLISNQTNTNSGGFTFAVTDKLDYGFYGPHPVNDPAHSYQILDTAVVNLSTNSGNVGRNQTTSLDLTANNSYTVALFANLVSGTGTGSFFIDEYAIATSQSGANNVDLPQFLEQL
jgi:hypothetical protein